MTEFTREQKKEFLIQELELTQEIDALERQISSEILCKCEMLRIKRDELSDIQPILRMIRQ